MADENSETKFLEVNSVRSNAPLSPVFTSLESPRRRPAPRPAMSAMTVDAPTPTAYLQHALASPELSAELRPFFERFSVLYEAK